MQHFSAFEHVELCECLLRIVNTEGVMGMLSNNVIINDPVAHSVSAGPPICIFTEGAGSTPARITITDRTVLNLTLFRHCVTNNPLC